MFVFLAGCLLLGLAFNILVTNGVTQRVMLTKGWKLNETLGGVGVVLDGRFGGRGIKCMEGLFFLFWKKD